MPFNARILGSLVVVASLVGVSSSAAQKKKDPYFLTQEEIAEHKDIRTAFDAVQQLRPRFLRASKSFSSETRVTSSVDKKQQGEDPTGGTSPSDGILVVVNGARQGGVSELKGIIADQIESIRFIKTEEARSNYGTDQAGVIEVKLISQVKSPGD